MEAATHQPVLLEEVLHWLAPASGGTYVDGNLGLGGHAAAILAASAPDGRLLGFEWDQQALEQARRNLAPWGARVTTVRRNFSELEAVLVELAIRKIDGLLLDLGLSSLQLAAGGRGFSFQADEPLDMRMDQRGGETAAALLQRLSAAELADIFYYYGEERQARPIAARVVAERRRGPISTSGQLAELVARAVPRRFHPRNIHVATRVFQALRIAVNRELENLEKILATAPSLLAAGARCCVISFHSLEDRLVKQAFAGDRRWRVLTGKPVTPAPPERQSNPRARSARLRVAEKLAVTDGGK